MRDIRFRAWDAVDKVMYHDIQLGITFDDGSKYTFDMFLQSPPGDYHKWHIMQFTGLFDKNGKEVYEADHVQHLPTAFDGRSYEGIIIWHEGHCRFALKCADQSSQFLDSLNTYEIIGDIHEHKHLLLDGRS